MAKRSINQILDRTFDAGACYNGVDCHAMRKALREARALLVRVANLERYVPDCDRLLKKWDEQ